MSKKEKLSGIILSLYQKQISPVFVILFGHACRFTPTCSEYTKEAISKYGIFKGIFLGTKRVLKCNPLVKGGYDPV